MIYLDYAAHTPADKEVLDVFYDTEIKYIANPNAGHHLGAIAGQRLNDATLRIQEMLHIENKEIIYTSGATESNNLAIKGIAKEYSKYGKHIITSYLEHASVTGSIIELQNNGFEVDFVDIKSDGLVDLDHLKELLRDDTILVSLCAVDSEVGTIQNIEKIAKLVSNYPNCRFHADATQAVGKVPLSLDCVDLATFSAHKFYGISGIGALVKKKEILLSPLLHGGISTTAYRSGTPALSLIASMEKAMSLVMGRLDENYRYVKELNDEIRKGLEQYKNIQMNSPANGSPYILNFSMKGMKSGVLQKALEEEEIYLSTKSACCAVNTPSKPVYAITKDKKRALSTLRVSLSHKTTIHEAEYFLESFAKCYQQI